MTAGAAIAAPINLNYENVAVENGYDNVFNRVWQSVSTLLDRLVDPAFVWLFWLGIGFALGAIAYSFLRRLEETSRGRLGGPSFVYLRWEARLIRYAIAWPWLRKISSDFEKDLHDLNQVLTSVHGFPALPAATFGNERALEKTSEYLRLILPNLRARHLDEARASALRLTSTNALQPESV